MHFSDSRWLADVRMRIDSNRLRAITGTRTFSSNAPCVPATVTAVSLPITWAATWSTTSGITGLTLPGMIDEPFWSSGSCSSPSPVRGPEPISTRSLAILVSDTATTLSAPCSSTSASRLAWASKRSRGASPRPSFSRTRSANSGWVLRPVPVAVPPSGISDGAAEGVPNAVAAERDLGRVAAELLAERHRAPRPSCGCGRP